MQDTQILRWETWNSYDYPPGQQYEAWEAALSDSFLQWSLMTRCDKGFEASIKSMALHETELLQCASDPCVGQHTRSHIAQNIEAHYAFLMILGGTEHLQIGDRSITLHPQEAVLWDSTQETQFQFTDRLEKVTLLIPQDYLKTKLPDPDRYVGNPIDMRQGVSKFTYDCILSLMKNDQSSDYSALLSRILIETLVACLESQLPSPPSTKSRRSLLNSILSYIEEHLDDIDLIPENIAQHFFISVRMLYLLFEEQGTTVSLYIRNRRLERCKEELMLLQNDDSITRIATRWGFNDPSYFSRVFKAQYGMPPSIFRKTYQSQ